MTASAIHATSGVTTRHALPVALDAVHDAARAHARPEPLEQPPHDPAVALGPGQRTGRRLSRAAK